MRFDTYAKLKAAIPRYINVETLENVSDLAEEFIELCEASLRRDIRARPSIQTLDTTIGDTTYPLPCGFDGIVSLTRTSDDRTPITYSPPDILDSLYPEPHGYGTRYTISGSFLYFDAAPGDVRMRYRALFSPLSTPSSCNWILKDHPDAYLYGSLMQSAPYLRDDERIAVWQGLYRDAVDAINAQARRQQTGGPHQMRSSATP